MLHDWIAGAAKAVVLAAVLFAIPAQAQAPDKQHIQAARSMMDKSGASRGFDDVVPSFLEESKRLFLQTRPEIAAELDQVSLAIAPDFLKRKEELLNSIAALYVRRFSVQELRQIEAFYNTPVGQKFVDLLPGILGQAREVSADWSAQLSEDIVTRMRAEMKKRGIDL
jgi:hypothetical protein